MNDLMKRTWAEIDLTAIRHNYQVIRSTLPKNCRFLGVVKADAYGHGALIISKLLEEAGPGTSTRRHYNAHPDSGTYTDSVHRSSNSQLSYSDGNMSCQSLTVF